MVVGFWIAEIVAFLSIAFLVEVAAAAIFALKGVFEERAEFWNLGRL